MFLKVSPIKGVMQFGKKGKLSPYYVGPFFILKRVGNVAHELELPSFMGFIRPIFLCFDIEEMWCDPSLEILLESVGVSDSLSYEKIPIKNFDRQARWLRIK